MYNTATVKGGSLIRPVLLCGDVRDAERDFLSSLSIETKLLPSFSRLAKPVSSHADMLVFPNGDEILVHIDYFSENRDFFSSLPVNIITTDEQISEKYPRDILLNSLLIDNTLYARLDYTSKKIRSLAKKEVPVKQGYSRCSTLVVSDKAIITADRGIAKAFSENTSEGESLLISEGHIALKGYDCGFIGGASVKLPDNKLAFFGDISKHPDFERIKLFAERHGCELVSLSDTPLRDVGGGVIIS